eukprot:2148686-Rhodomonas_salina.4
MEASLPNHVQERPSGQDHSRTALAADGTVYQTHRHKCAIPRDATPQIPTITANLLVGNIRE